MASMRVYLEGKEINEIAELKDVCASDDWFDAFMRWLSKNRPGFAMEVIVGLEATNLEDGNVLEVWVPKAPPHRATELGGVLRRMVQQKR